MWNTTKQENVSKKILTCVEISFVMKKLILFVLLVFPVLTTFAQIRHSTGGQHRRNCIPHTARSGLGARNDGHAGVRQDNRTSEHPRSHRLSDIIYRKTPFIP